MVVPVPTVLKQGDVKVVDKAVIDAVDAFSAPRMAEYHDEDPCFPEEQLVQLRALGYLGEEQAAPATTTTADLGVRVEAEYSVEEYDVLILSANDSKGLQTWLQREGYRIPPSARDTLASYIKQGLRFFVAKVDVSKLPPGDVQELRPLQVHYRSPRFMLPIRLGTVNADGPQDLLVFTLTRHGRVETSNYRTVPIPTDVEIPPWVKDDFGSFYLATIDRLLENEGPSVVMQEYAWPLSVMCDPCSSDPLTINQLRALGANWIAPGRGKLFHAAFLTRLHARYTAETFPADLRLHETRDRNSAQGRYVIRHPFTSSRVCDEAEAYQETLVIRQREEAATLARLTGWRVTSVGNADGWMPEVGPPWDPGVRTE